MKKAKTFSLNLRCGIYLLLSLSFYKQGHGKFGISLAFNYQSCIMVLPQILIPFSLLQKYSFT